MESNLYTLVEWPESQIFMDEDWFLEEACLADSEKFGSSAYFIPTNRILQNENDSETMEQFLV